MDCTATLTVNIYMPTELGMSLCVWRLTKDHHVLYVLSLPYYMDYQFIYHYLCLSVEWKLCAAFSFEFVSVAIANADLFVNPQCSEYGWK